MRALVVYESMFGNTRLVAEAVADGLSSVLDVDVVEVAAAPTSFDDVELLVVGGPTHAFGMTRQRTRDDARRQAEQSGHEVVSMGIGMREWLERSAVHRHRGGRVRHPRRQVLDAGLGGAGRRQAAAQSRIPVGRPAGELLGVRHVRPAARGRARAGPPLGRAAGVGGDRCRAGCRADLTGADE